MQDAYQRLGQLEYRRSSLKGKSRFFLHADHYIGENSQAHLLSIFGNDAEVGAIAGAVQANHTFEMTYPDGTRQIVGFGPNASTHKGVLKLPDEKKPVRHLIVTSQALHANGSAGKTFILNYKPETRALTWSTLTSLLGVPADPAWAAHMLALLEQENRVLWLSGVGCKPALIQITRAELLNGLSQGLRSSDLHFPEKNGPIRWPKFRIDETLRA